MKYKNRKVLITGGGAGIGRSLLKSFLEEGAEVAVFEINDVLIEDLKNKFPSVFSIKCDVSDSLSVNESVSKLEQSLFYPDILINNAGLIHSELLVDFTKSQNERVHSLENWKKIIATNLDSVFFVTGQIVNQMIDKRIKGTVISISSIAAKGNIGQSAYSASKAAVDALTKTWSKEYGVLGIRFASIAPGFLSLPSTEKALKDYQIKKIINQIPLKKLGNVNSIFLAAQSIIDNPYITGTIIEIDGGLTI